MNDPQVLDPRLVRRAFERAAASYDAAAALAREVADRMLERLDLIRQTPQRVLDLGSATGYCARKLLARYTNANVVQLDVAPAMLRAARDASSWWQRGIERLTGTRTARVCADMHRLPFAARSFDMVWSNLALHWVPSPQDAFVEIHRVLRPGGVCMMSTLGPDTLKELRASFAAADQHVHVNRFVDLHDLGDMLVAARFADPVMDMECLTLTYSDVRSLLLELKACGAHNVNAGRNPGLTGKRCFETFMAAYEKLGVEGRIPATFEIVYGHAWRAERERVRDDGLAVIDFHPPRAGSTR